MTTEAKKATIKVTQIGSPIGRPGDQRQALIGLGLNKINRTKIIADTPENRGRIRKMAHLLKVESVEA